MRHHKQMTARLLVGTMLLTLAACSAGQAATPDSDYVPQPLAAAVSIADVVTAKEELTFPIGMEVPFNGTGYLAPMIANEEVYNFPQTNNIVFEPGARSDWHRHGGMIILVTGGVGYYQEEGKPAQILRKGDVLEIAPGVNHWHGATADSWFSQMVIFDSHYTGGGGESKKVTDEEYAALQTEEYTGRTVTADNAFMFQRAANPSSSRNFSGAYYLSDLVGNNNAAGAPGLHYVAFDPGVVNNWHTHEGGQILIATDGIGYHQIEGQPVEVLHPGDVAYCPPGVKHWHGGSADSSFAHIAINTNPDRSGVEWFDRISDAEYSQLSTTGFTDVPAGADYADAVAWCREQGLMNGTSDTEFSPDATLTRAMVVTVLYRWAGQPSLENEILGYPFADVDATAWYGNAVYWARLNGVVQGYGDDRFGTEDPITHEQLDIILRRYKGETPTWTGDPALNVPATRAEAAVAFCESLSQKEEKPAADSITTNGGTEIALAGLEHWTDNADAPVVYYTSDISAVAMVKIYDALKWTPTGKVAVKLSTGEPPASNYLRPELIKDVVEKVDGTIVECNTAYGGSRSSTAMHYQVAKDHGFTDIADFQILDKDGSMSIPVNGGTKLKENFVGKHFADYDSYLVLSHFKGHAMAGLGGAIKNISIGLGSSEGKCWIHSAGTSKTNPWGGQQDAFLESMGDAGKAVSDYLGNGERIVYISVMNRLSVDCDCDGNPAEPDMHDIGILASADPVALDQACVDLVYAAPDHESLANRMESRNGIHTLENAEVIGLGSRTYQLVDIG